MKLSFLFYWSHHLASFNGHVKIVRTLLELNAQVDTKDFEGISPLEEATSRNYKSVVELLLEYNADPNIVNIHKQGVTPLYLAC